jgi:uncharacterized protein YoxC
MSTIDVTKLVRDVQESTMQQAFYLQSKAFFEKNNEHINEIARLKAEVEAVTQEYRDATNHYNNLHNDLQAEVERLRKAGDEVVSRIQVCTEDLWCSIHRWNAAREGKPSV